MLLFDLLKHVLSGVDSRKRVKFFSAEEAACSSRLLWIISIRFKPPKTFPPQPLDLHVEPQQGLGQLEVLRAHVLLQKSSEN